MFKSRIFNSELIKFEFTTETLYILCNSPKKVRITGFNSTSSQIYNPGQKPWNTAPGLSTPTTMSFIP